MIEIDSQKHEMKYKYKVTWCITRNHSRTLVILGDEKICWNKNCKEKPSTDSEKTKAYCSSASVFTRESSHVMMPSNISDSGVIAQLHAGK